MFEAPSFYSLETEKRQPTGLRDLKVISRLVNALFALAVLAMVAYAASVAKDFMTIGDDLRQHMATVVRKGDLLNHLRAASGYGGFIHNFKNYVLRLEDFRPHQLKADLYTLFTSIDDYRTLGLSLEEEDALDTLERTFTIYESMIPKIAELSARGYSPGEIDRQVKIDDAEALRAYEILQTYWRKGREQYSEQLEASVGTGLRELRYALFGLPAFILVGIGLLWFQRRLVNEVQAYADVSEQLAIANALNEAVLNSVSYAIVGTDVNGTVTVFNRAASQLLGYTAEELIGKIKPYVFHDDEEVEQRAAALSESLGIDVPPGPKLFNVMVKARGTYTDEWTYIRKDGSKVPVLLSLAPVDASGDPSLGLVSIAYDITERKKLDNMQREFVSTVNHELRTPLTSISGSLALVRGGAAGEVPEKARFLIEIAHKNSERLIQLVNDILDIERLETGRMTFNLEDARLTALIEDAVSANSAYAAARKIKLEIGETADVVTRVDTGRVLQVLANLLSNAAKFSPDGGTVEVTSRLIDGKVKVAVADHGTGVPPKYRDKVFERFWQIDATDSRAKQGTGLGLPIAQAIVEHLGGEIGIETTPGGGATFWFTLPCTHSGTPAQAGR
mgnify:CR=1 FL=1